MAKLNTLNDFYPHKNWGLLRGSFSELRKSGSFFVPELVEMNRPASDNQDFRIQHLQYLTELLQEIFPDASNNHFETNLFSTEQAKNYLQISSW